MLKKILICAALATVPVNLFAANKKDDEPVVHLTDEEIYQELQKEEGTTVPEIGKLILTMFESADLPPVGAAIYRIMYDINRKEGIDITEERKPGRLEGLTAPVFRMRLAKKEKSL